MQILPGKQEAVPNQNLTKWMRLAQERNSEKAIKKIGAIIQKERWRLLWQWLNYVTGKKRSPSAMSVQDEHQLGLVSESTTKDAVEEAIFREVHDKQCTLAREAPICSGRLFDDFGYVPNTPASRAVLDGAYQVPTNSDIAMMELFDEIAAVTRIIPKDSAPIVITPEQWKRY